MPGAFGVLGWLTATSYEGFLACLNRGGLCPLFLRNNGLEKESLREAHRPRDSHFLLSFLS